MKLRMYSALAGLALFAAPTIGSAAPLGLDALGQSYASSQLYAPFGTANFTQIADPVQANFRRDRYDDYYERNDRRDFRRDDFYRQDTRFRNERRDQRRDRRTWRGDDGRNYCQRDDGTTGLLIGGAAGAVIGNEVARRGDKTVGAILGGLGGALLGRSIDRGGSRCR